MNPLIDVPDIKNHVAFSILEKSVNKYKTSKPLIVGITGAGGAGKTTFADNIVLYYGKEHCATIDLDDYLISREERGTLGLTGYHPQANNLSLARDNILELINCKDIQKPTYNHVTGKSGETQIVNSRPLIIIEGVTTLYPELADLINISFYLDALESTQIQSRIERDVNKRGYTLQQALTLFEALKPDYKKYIEPGKKLASVVFEVGTDYVMRIETMRLNLE
jgi:phosphoribulokinase